MPEVSREKFKSSLGSILALAGSAVGLGNIWRFPYMLSEYGGGAFLLVYIICMAAVAMPLMMSEFIVGRRSQTDAYHAFSKLEPKGIWKHFGFLSILVPTATLCYYCIIGGWTLDYLLKACSFQFHSAVSDAEIEYMFGDLVTRDIKPLIFTALFLLMAGFIVMMGVRKGIEKCSKIMMPLLFFVMVAIAIYSISLPGAKDGLKYIFYTDFSKITPKVCLAAMGQAFYSLSIGTGIMVTYSSYLKRSASLTKTAAYTISSDFIFAIIAGCAIIPVLFATGSGINQGTGLVFKTLPVVFASMPLGRTIAIVFFFAVLLAALTSAISLFEVPVSWLSQRESLSRKKASVIVFLVTLAVGIPCSLSFGSLNWMTLGGKNLFDIFDFTVGNYLMPLCGLTVVLFVGWKMKKSDIYDECFNGHQNSGKKNSVWFVILYYSIRFISPAAIIIIFLSGILG